MLPSSPLEERCDLFFFLRDGTEQSLVLYLPRLELERVETVVREPWGEFRAQWRQVGTPNVRGEMKRVLPASGANKK
jgi:hypothetical protein